MQFIVPPVLIQLDLNAKFLTWAPPPPPILVSSYAAQVPLGDLKHRDPGATATSTVPTVTQCHIHYI